MLTAALVRLTTMTRRDAAGLVAGGVDIGLERNLAAAAQAFVGGDDDGRFAVLDAAGDRIRREAAEDHRMHRADARAGEDGIRPLPAIIGM